MKRSLQPSVSLLGIYTVVMLLALSATIAGIVFNADATPPVRPAAAGPADPATTAIVVCLALALAATLTAALLTIRRRPARGPRPPGDAPAARCSPTPAARDKGCPDGLTGAGAAPAAAIAIHCRHEQERMCHGRPVCRQVPDLLPG